MFAVVYALRTDLFGARVRKVPAVTSAPPEIGQPQKQKPLKREIATSENTKRLVITSGAKQGLEIPLGEEPLTIGRSADSGLIIRDDYTSTHHARLFLWGQDWAIQDLDSTNGTFLDETRVGVPTAVPLNTPVRIGTTTFELRR